MMRRAGAPVFFAVLLALSGITAIAADTRETTLGVIGIKYQPSDPSFEQVWLVDFNRREPESDTPYLYEVLWKVSAGQVVPLEEGKTYRATVQVPSSVVTITAKGVTYDTPSFFFRAAYACDPPLSPKGGHWIWLNGDAFCRPGRAESIAWQSESGSYTPEAATSADSDSRVGDVYFRNNYASTSAATLYVDGYGHCAAASASTCVIKGVPLGEHYAFIEAGGGTIVRHVTLDVHGPVLGDDAGVYCELKPDGRATCA